MYTVFHFPIPRLQFSAPPRPAAVPYRGNWSVIARQRWGDSRREPIWACRTHRLSAASPRRIVFYSIFAIYLAQLVPCSVTFTTKSWQHNDGLLIRWRHAEVAVVVRVYISSALGPYRTQYTAVKRLERHTVYMLHTYCALVVTLAMLLRLISCRFIIIIIVENTKVLKKMQWCLLNMRGLQLVSYRPN